MIKIKKKRERDRNWTSMEKEMLKLAIEPFLDIVRSKCNNMVMIEKKDHVWRKIAANLRPLGIEFSIKKLRQQYGRMQLQEHARLRTKTTTKNETDIAYSDVNIDCDGFISECQPEALRPIPNAFNVDVSRSIEQDDHLRQAQDGDIKTITVGKNDIEEVPCDVRIKSSVILNAETGDITTLRKPNKKDFDEAHQTVNDRHFEQYFKKETSASEVSDLDVGSCSNAKVPIKQKWNEPSLEQQLFEKKLERIDVQMAQENELHKIRKQIAIKQLELVKLRIKKEY